MRKLWILFEFLDRRDRWRLAGLFVMLLVASVLEVIGVGIVLPFIQVVQHPDRILENGKIGPLVRATGVSDPQQALLVVGVALIGFFLVKNAYLALMFNSLYRFGFGRAAVYATRLLREYMNAPYIHHIQQNASHLVRNATTEVQHVFATIRYVLDVTTELLVLGGVLLVLWIAEPVAALVGFVLMGGVGLGMTQLVRRRLREISRIRHREDARRVGWIHRSFGGFKEARVLGREEFFVEGFGTSSAMLLDTLRRNSMINTVPRLLIESVAVIGLVGFVVALLLSGRASGSTFGAVALFGVATVRLIPSTRKIVAGVNDIRFNLPAVQAVSAEFRRAREAAAARPVPDDTRPIVFREGVRFENVSFLYPTTSVPAVRGVDLEIRRGESIAFVGPSGAGKTTLVDILLGLLEPTSGRILADGVDIRQHLPAWQKHIGYIPQAIFLIDDSIRRNVAFGLYDEEIDDDRVWAALEAAQLSDFVRDLDKGLETWVGERGVRLSGGQRQRVGIARALYHDPDVLVLDEATSSLDSRTERELEAAVRRMAADKTLVVIAHRLSTVRDCDRIVVMSEGTIVGTGTYDELERTNRLFQQLVRGAAETHDLESVTG